MEEAGMLYLCKTLGSLFGIPTRVYKDKELLQMFSLVNLYKDPFILEDKLLDDIDEDIRYITTTNSFYYCLLNALPYQIVVGPFKYFPVTKQVIADLAFKLDIPREEKHGFESAISSITNMPLETVIQALCSYNFTLNGKMLSIDDITINKNEKTAYEAKTIEDTFDNNKITTTRNSTLEIEKVLEKFVEDGNLDGFIKWTKSAPAIRAGAMSNDYLRHQKDTFIVACTIFSRAAIRGGLSYNDALDLSDEYIQKCENAKTYSEITNLNYVMLKDFITRVERIKSNESPLETKIANYIYNHISEPILLDSLADYLYISKSNLCLRFKKETGLTISQFVLEKKIEESKKLLEDSTKTISMIAFYLGFSSQAHFTKVFKELTGETPIKYRNK